MHPGPRVGPAVRSQPLDGHFTGIDWAILIAYLGLTTWAGARLAGRQSTIRDFFLGGRKLPWYAVSGSIIATEISAVTFISLPAVVYAPGGDMRYLQLALGAILARVIIGLWFVPAFYEREIYSPYDYIGGRLGAPVRTLTSGLFMLGALLGQSARVLLTALILEEITDIPLPVAIWIIGAVAIAWTLLGGITTVIWTDLVQFFVFAGALIAALAYIVQHVPGGWDAITELAGQAGGATGQPAGKLRLWDLRTDPRVPFTLWAGLLGNTLMCLNSYGTDQMMAQRIFCCRGRRQATLAVIASSVGLLVAVLAVAVGLGLYAFYQVHPLDPAAAERVAQRVDRIFPIFIVREVPAGPTGLIIAGVFAAAISSLDSVLAALAQTVVTGFYQPWRARRAGSRSQPGGAGAADEQHFVRVSKLLVVGWGVALCGMAHVADLARERYGDILNLALEMATYTAGTLLAAFLLALWRLNVDGRGIVWAAPLSVLSVFAVTWHARWAQAFTLVAAVAVVVGWIASALALQAGAPANRQPLMKTPLVMAGAALPVFLCSFQPEPGVYLRVAWPWNVPIGFAVAMTFGYLLARPRAAEALSRTA